MAHTFQQLQKQLEDSYVTIVAGLINEIEKRVAALHSLQDVLLGKVQNQYMDQKEALNKAEFEYYKSLISSGHSNTALLSKSNSIPYIITPIATITPITTITPIVTITPIDETISSLSTNNSSVRDEAKVTEQFVGFEHDSDDIHETDRLPIATRIKEKKLINDKKLIKDKKTKNNKKLKKSKNENDSKQLKWKRPRKRSVFRTEQSQYDETISNVSTQNPSISTEQVPIPITIDFNQCNGQKITQQFDGFSDDNHDSDDSDNDSLAIGERMRKHRKSLNTIRAQRRRIKSINASRSNKEKGKNGQGSKTRKYTRFLTTAEIKKIRDDMKKKHITKCPYCSYKGSKALVKKHLTVHTVDKPYACPICAKPYKNPQSVTHHRNKKNH
eukprot:387219_1